MDTNGSKQLTSFWDKVKIASTVFGTVLIPLVVAYASNEYTNAIKQNEIGQRYVELAVGILAKPPTDTTMHTRAWAVEVVNHYSGIRMSDNAQRELIDEQLKVINSAVKSATEVVRIIGTLQ